MGPHGGEAIARESVQCVLVVAPAGSSARPRATGSGRPTWVHPPSRQAIQQTRRPGAGATRPCPGTPTGPPTHESPTHRTTTTAWSPRPISGRWINGDTSIVCSSRRNDRPSMSWASSGGELPEHAYQRPWRPASAVTVVIQPRAMPTPATPLRPAPTSAGGRPAGPATQQGDAPGSDCHAYG